MDLSIASALSTDDDSLSAADFAGAQIQSELGGPADLAMLFVSPHHADQLQAVAQSICQRLGTDRLLGCTGESIVGPSQEIEEGPALALWAARLPSTSVATARIDFEQTPDGPLFAGWPSEWSAADSDSGALLLLADPFSFPADVLAAHLNQQPTPLRLIGGMASGGWGPGKNRLVLGEQVASQGAVAALLQGPVRLRTVVSQGCKPVGRHFVITKAERNLILELSGLPAMRQLQNVYESLDLHDRQLFRQGLHVGRAMSEYRDNFRRGDFLVRNVVGADPNSGAIAVGDYFRPGQTVQFHIRDRESADQDLQALLQQARHDGASPAGALLFTCNGRGTRLFDVPNHDIQCLASEFGPLPAAGIFAQGELGPVGGQNFLHGFTASIALFESASSEPAPR